MKILLYTQYFPPETNAPANRWDYFTRYLANKGHQVVVLTTFPHHPLGKIFPGYKNRWFYKEERNGVIVLRTGIFVSSSSKFWARALNYLSFSFSSYLNSGRVKNPDLIIASVPPLTVGIVGQWISSQKRIPLVVDLRDFWPEAASSTGYLSSGGFLYRCARQRARSLYQKARVILVNSPGLAEELVLGYGISRGKIQLVYNGADIEFFESGNPEIIDKRYNLKNKFVVLYTGLLGFAQSPVVMIEAARILQKHKDIVFLIVGTGPKYPELERKVQDYHLQNVVLTGLRPRQEMPSFVQRADICLVPYKNSPVFRRNIPSKIYDYMAAGKPIIINLEGEASKIILSAQAGILIKPNDAQSLAQTILGLKENKILREKMGFCAQTYARRHYHKREIGELLEAVLRYVIHKS